MTEFKISEIIPSQNITDREHWAARKRRNKKFREQIALAILLKFKKKERDLIFSKPKNMLVNIHSQRKRRILDDANLRGGSKGLVDSLVRLGLIFDDDDKYVSIEYTQDTGKPYFTRISIEPLA